MTLQYKNKNVNNIGLLEGEIAPCIHLYTPIYTGLSRKIYLHSVVVRNTTAAV